MALSISNAPAILMCNALVDALDLGTADPTGTIIIYSGTAPALCDDALSGNTVLAELELSNPAFGGAVDVTPGARATANAIASDPVANATGTASFFRAFDRDNIARFQGNVTATGGGGMLEVNTVSFVAGATVQITALTVTMPEA